MAVAEVLQLLLFEDILEEDFSVTENEDDIFIFSAICTFMCRHLQRNENFFERIIPSYLPDEFMHHFRMSRTTIENLCAVVAATGRVPQRQSFGRPPIPLDKQVLVFIWFISNNEVIRSVSDRFDITLSSLERVIHRISRALCDVRQRYIKWPNRDEMNAIMQNFEESFPAPGFPRIIGLIDGTHIRIRAPTKNPDAYVNRKKYHSLITQVVCDDNMLFRDIVVGWPDSIHDSRVLRLSSLCATAEAKFPGNTHLLGDGGYPLKSWLITPFRDNGHLNARQKRFNSKLSGLRSLVERAIRLLKGRWRKLSSIEHIDIELLVHLIMSACVLHNFCLIHDDFDDSYFLDQHSDDGADNDGGDNYENLDGELGGEDKRIQLMNIIC